MKKIIMYQLPNGKIVNANEAFELISNSLIAGELNSFIANQKLNISIEDLEGILEFFTSVSPARIINLMQLIEDRQKELLTLLQTNNVIDADLNRTILSESDYIKLGIENWIYL